MPDRWDAWDRDATTWVVIPTNAGWTFRYTGSRWGPVAIMGAGLAKQAAGQYPEVASFYGEECHGYWKKTGGLGGPLALYEPGKLVLFPTKPLDRYRPELSWKNPADIFLVRHHAEELATMIQSGRVEGRVHVPALGCGLGGLDIEKVGPMLEEVLGWAGDRVVFCW